MRLWSVERNVALNYWETWLWYVNRTQFWIVERMWLWSTKRNAALNGWEYAALTLWEKRGSDPLRETWLWSVESNASLRSLVWWRGHSLQDCEGTQTLGRDLRSVACILTRRSRWIFQCEVGIDGWDARRWDFPEQKFTCLIQTGFDIHIAN